MAYTSCCNYAYSNRTHDTYSCAPNFYANCQDSLQYHSEVIWLTELPRIPTHTVRTAYRNLQKLTETYQTLTKRTKNSQNLQRTLKNIQTCQISYPAYSGSAYSAYRSVRIGAYCALHWLRKLFLQCSQSPCSQ